MQRPRLMILLLAVAVVAAACSSSSDDSTTTSTTSPATTTTVGTTSTTVAVASMPLFEDDDELIPVDSEVTIGVLDNGLTYYVRRNTRPGARAQLRLAVAAGSALEDPDQAGVAHYLEHMMFNGTESFPANELVRVLERFGSEFGPDINAYTNLDETVYELEVPTDTAGILETALDVLFEWSAKATIDPDEVDAERGVLLEEWRLRSQSFSGRYFDAVSDVLLEGSPYAGHDPLAEPDELDDTSADTLRRFYEDWYRPDLMAVVAVGDFDVQEVEELIRERFGRLELPTSPRPRPVFTTDPFSTTAAVVLADPESPNAFVELNYPLSRLEPGRVGSIRQEIALSLAFEMIRIRLDEDSRRTDAPYFNPSHAANPFVTAQRTPGLAAFADPPDLEGTQEALLTEVRRAQLHGFTEDELSRAVSEMMAQVDLTYETFASKQDEQFAAEYVANFLAGFPIPGAEADRDLTARLLEEMTAEQVTATWQATIESTRPLVIVAGPESASEQIPDEATVLRIAGAADGASPAPRADTEVTADRLMTAPAPVEIVSRSNMGSLRPIVLELENGIRVAYVVSDIAVNTVSFQATSPGGWLLLPAEDAVEAQLIGTVVAESGVAGLDQVALDRFLTGEVVQVFTGIDEVSEIIVGGAESDDLERLFQLIHLYFTQPRADQPALDAVLGELRPLAMDREAIPFLALADQLQVSRYDADPRYLPVPALADLETFDLARALELQQERFADASDFVFTFAGDFGVDELETLVTRYLGSLPTGGEPETAGTGQPPPPDGVIFEVVDSGDGELGAVAFQFTQPMELTRDVRLTAPLLESVLNQRLTALLREELGATYSPFVTLTMQDDPVELLDVSVQVSGNPEGLQGIADALEADLAELAANGPTVDEFAIAQEQTIRDYELIGNQFWLDLMTFYLLHPGEDPDQVISRIEDTQALSRTDVRSLARRVLLFDDYIRVDLVPVG